MKLKINFIAIALFALTILLELLFSNNPSDLFISGEESAIDLSDVTLGTNTTADGSGIKFHQNGAAFQYKPETQQAIKNIYLQLQCDIETIVTGEIHVKDENFSESFHTLNQFQVNPNGSGSVIVPVKSGGNLKEIEIVLTNGIADQPIILNSAVLNKASGLQFNLLRWILMALLVGCSLLIKKFALTEINFDPQNVKHIALTTLIIVCNLAVALLIALSIKDPKKTDIPYPLERNPDAYTIMVQQFDAFQKGRLDLDIASDESLAKLKSLDNPYDNSQRDAVDLGFNSWDHAYYEGKLYSYFGVAPILTIYYPHYWLTGTLPSDAKTGLILSYIFIIFSALLIVRIISCFKLRVNLITACLTMLALPSASMLFMMQACSDFYYLPYLSAYAFIICFLYASLSAYQFKEQIKSSIGWFIGAGLFLALAVASRPTVIIPAFFLILPLYLHVLTNKKLTVKQKVCYVTGFAVPTAIGAIMIMHYNNARFDSPFEFGATYQLTVSDVHFNKVSFGFEQIWSYIHHYWLHPLVWHNKFPFLDYAANQCFADGRFTYHPNPICLSVFAVPLNLFLLTFPCLLKQRKRYQKGMLLGGLISSFVILYIAFCVGGIIIRYSFDAFLILTLLSCLAAWKLIDFFNHKKIPAAKHAINMIIVASIIVGYLLIFNNERNYIKSNAPSVYLYLKNLFTFM